jgi:uncharacterized protein YceK
LNFRIYLRVDPSDYFIGDYLTLDGKPLEHHASDTVVTSVQSATNGSCEVFMSQPITVGNGASGCCGVRRITLTEEVEATANMGVAVAKTQEEEWNEMPPLVSLDLPSSIPSASSAESFTQERTTTAPSSPLKINSSVIIPTAVDADTNAVAESSYASATATTVVAPAASSRYEATAISAIKVANSSCGNGRDELIGVDDLGLSTCPDDTTATIIEGKPGGPDEERSERPVVASAEDVTRAVLRGRNGEEEKENVKERENAYREDIIKRIIADGCSEAYHTLLHNKKGIYKSPTRWFVGYLIVGSCVSIAIAE